MSDQPFRKGDSVRLNDRGRAKQSKWSAGWLRVGVYMGTTRDGRCDKVHWLGTIRPRTITKGFLEAVETHT